MARPNTTTATAHDVETLGRLIGGVLAMIEYELERPLSEVCDRCGCLCKPTEVCPGCRWTVEQVRRSTAAVSRTHLGRRPGDA